MHLQEEQDNGYNREEPAVGFESKFHGNQYKSAQSQFVFQSVYKTIYFATIIFLETFPLEEFSV